MERTVAAQAPGTDAEGIFRELTVRQHLTPLVPLGQVLAETVERIGACPVAAERAMVRLDLDENGSIGRLKRGELIQLARSLYRLWSRAIEIETPTAE